jgi:hypothetical protein
MGHEYNDRGGLEMLGFVCSQAKHNSIKEPHCAFLLIGTL